MKRGKKAALLIQAAEVLRRARKLTVGPTRNDLRQQAMGLLNLHRAGLRADVQIIGHSTPSNAHGSLH